MIIKFAKIKNLKVYQLIFGYDIFISYSRFDSLDYAYSIAQHFIAKGYECYIDQLSSSTPGKELPTTIQDAVKNSTSFVLIGSSGSKISIPIKKEIQTFLSKTKNLPIIPITIDNAISNDCVWFSEIDGLALIHETSKNLKYNTPSNDVLNRIESALNFSKKSKRLKVIALMTVLLFVLVSGLAFLYTSYHVSLAAKEIVKANSTIVEQKKISDAAIKDTEIAVKQKIKAESINKMLELRTDSLNFELLNKYALIEQATSRYTKQFNSTKEILNEFNLTIDAVPFLKRYCYDKNLVIKKGEFIIFGKLDMTVGNKANKTALSEFIKEWNNSTNKPQIVIDGYYFGYKIDEESFDILKLTGKGQATYNLQASSRNCKVVSDYLIGKGIPNDKILSHSYGDANKLSEGVLFNNRIELYTAN